MYLLIIIAQLHLMTDCVHKCGFYGKSKKKVTGKVLKSLKEEVFYANVAKVYH